MPCTTTDCSNVKTAHAQSLPNCYGPQYHTTVMIPFTFFVARASATSRTRERVAYGAGPVGERTNMQSEGRVESGKCRHKWNL